MSEGPQQADLGDCELFVPKYRNDPVVLRLAAGHTAGPPLRVNEELAVYVGGRSSCCTDRLPIAGRYERTGGVLTFRPAFGFAVGQDYVVRIGRCQLHQFVEFKIEALAKPSALVTAVYPSSDVLPENTLRFYIHFSVPMAPHCAPEFVRLTNDRGVADDAAFMRFKQELWNADRTRLTILMDPGRIKRGVVTRRDLGPALLEGRDYALVVEDGWTSADGSSVLPRFSKRFRVAAPLRERPDVSLWTWGQPQPGTRNPLKIRFDRPFDRHCLRESIRIVTRDGRRIAGTSKVGENELSVSFVPHGVWPAREVRIIVDEALEDVAGNSLCEVLDRKVTATEIRGDLR